MSRSSPSRSAPHEFATNVHAVRATDPTGRSLPITRPDPCQWTVEDHGGEVVFTYTLFANRADFTYSGIDRTHAHLNIPATFVWARGLEDRPVQVRFRVPEGSRWRIATQLDPTPDPEVFSAPDLAYFMDSPVELSDFELREWTVPGPNGPQTVRITVRHRDGRAALERYTAGVRAITAEEAGFTSYYDDLTMAWAGPSPGQEFARRLAGLADAVVNGPGRKMASPVEMSPGYRSWTPP